jgi:hypothetical protein
MYKSLRLVIPGACLLFLSTAGHAQLLDDSRVNQNGNVNAPGGTIARSLEDQIGPGRGNVTTPGSSIYLVKRDPARSIRRGRQLFQRKFSLAEGVGPRVNFDSTGDITQMRALGAGLTDSCAACHGRPRGSAGFGGDVATRPDSRDAPHLFGLGLVEQLANEMTESLRAIRTTAIAQATAGGSGVSCSIVSTNTWPGNYQVDVQVVNNGSSTTNGWSVTLNFNQAANIYNAWNTTITNGNTATVTASNVSYNAGISPGGSITFGVQGTRGSGTFTPPACQGSGGGGGSPVTMALTAKGVSFGSITANPDGSVNTSQVDGVNADLRVRPFFHQGGTVSMREFIVGAFKDEMGMQTPDPVLCAATDPVNPQIAVSPAGFVFNPSLDTFERPPVCSAGEDGDGDGVTNEIDPALLDHMEFYLLNYFKPGRYQVTARAQQGLQLMNSIGCTGCHVQNLTIDSDRRVADVETVYDPVNGIFNDLFATAATRFTPLDDGDPFPQLLPTGDSFTVANFFSDLKRHDLGPAFHEREYDGTLVTEFVTEPLWGVGSSAPYGHDGRSINLDQVIIRHGGEALQARQAYLGLTADNRRLVREYLETLILFPPDDTASNLNPGNPNTNNPQSPAEHGSINLGALFQIASEGPE